MGTQGVPSWTPGQAGIVGKQDVAEVQGKRKVLHLGLNNPRAQHTLQSAVWEEQPCWKGLGGQQAEYDPAVSHSSN